MSHISKQGDDAFYVRCVAAGDRDAFTLLVERHYDGAMRLCRGLLGSHSEAEDVVQDAVLLAFLNLGSLREPHRFGAWFCSIAANRARDVLRRRKFSSQFPEGDVSSSYLTPDTSPSPEEVRHARELHDAVVAALGELSEVNREVVVGYYMDGYSYRELAELLGVPVSTVKGRLHKGRRHLKPSLTSLAEKLFGVERKEKRMNETEKTDWVRVVTEEVVRVEPCDERGRERMRESYRGWPDSHRTEPSMEVDAVLLREVGSERILPIYVGIPEGNSIRVSISGDTLPRPMAHDLIGSIFGEVGIETRSVVISRLAEQTFYAEIILSQGSSEYRIDSRPSDAVALALRLETPIYAAKSVLEEFSHDSREAWLEHQRSESGLKIK